MNISNKLREENVRLLSLMKDEIKALKQLINNYYDEKQREKNSTEELSQRINELEFRVSLALNPPSVITEETIKRSSKTFAILYKLCQLELGQ